MRIRGVMGLEEASLYLIKRNNYLQLDNQIKLIKFNFKVPVIYLIQFQHLMNFIQQFGPLKARLSGIFSQKVIKKLILANII